MLDARLKAPKDLLKMAHAWRAGRESASTLVSTWSPPPQERL